MREILVGMGCQKWQPPPKCMVASMQFGHSSATAGTLGWPHEIASPRKQGGKSAHASRPMDNLVFTVATMDQCTQTPFPGSELLDPNPFVPSPVKPKDTHGVVEKRALPSVSVSQP